MFVAPLTQALVSMLPSQLYREESHGLAAFKPSGSTVPYIKFPVQLSLNYLTCPLSVSLVCVETEEQHKGNPHV